MRKTLIIALCCALAGLGCAELRIGRPVPEKALQRIRPGFTTRDEVVAMLGMPLRVVPSEGGEIWVYRYLDGRRVSQELVVSFGAERVSAFVYR